MLMEGDGEKVPAESSTPTPNEEKKKKKGKLAIDKESIAADLDVGIDIEAKFFEPIEASMNIDDWEVLSNEDIIKLVELHKQKNKKKMVLRITRQTMKLSFVDESVVDIEIPHHEVPRMWAPMHRGKVVLAVARNADLKKYRIYLIQMERSKGEAFLMKLEVSYKEKLIEGAKAPKIADSGAAAEGNQANGSEPQILEKKDESEEEKKPDEEPASETPATTEAPSSNLLDFDFADGSADSTGAKDVTFDSLLADAPAAPAPAASNPKSAILDLFSSPAPSNTAWANFGATPVQETARQTEMQTPGLIPPALAPPPGRVSPSQRRAVSPQPAPTNPMPAGISNVGSLGQPAVPFAPPFAGNSLFTQPEPQASASPFGTNGQSPFPTNGQSLFSSTAPPASTNPFAQPTGSAFQLDSMAAAFSEVRDVLPSQSAPPLQPQVVDNESLIDNPFETPEPPQPEASQAQVKMLGFCPKTAFGDLLDVMNFKPQSTHFASPKEMFAARDRKDKGPSLNDLSRN